jgi:hypothetical protein
VQNYGNTPDPGIDIVMYHFNGVTQTCSNLTLPPRTATFCHVFVDPGGICGCVVSGEGAATVVSLTVTDPATLAPQASVPCP